MSTLKEFIDRMFADRPARNDWYADTNVVWGRMANGFIELDERKDKRVAELEQQVSELQTYKLGFQGADEKAIALEAERDRLRELLDIFKDACDPGKLDHQKLKSTRGLKDE